MLNIRILAKAVLQIFHSQGCSYTKCLCLENGSNSKVNQFIYNLVCNYLPNIRILAKVVLKIFCSQGCSYTKCLCPKKGNNSTENLRNRFKSKSVHLHLGLQLYDKYQDSSQSGSSDILFTRFFIQSRKRGITPERQDWWRKKKITGSLIFHVHATYIISRF